MEKIIVKFPVPSCKINQLIWDEENKEWLFEYLITNKSNTKLTDDNKKDLYIYSHISNLTVTDKVNEGSINIIVHNMKDIEKLITQQATQDRLYREKWIKEHPDYLDNVLKYETNNITHKPKPRYIISILSQEESNTTFIMSR